MARESDGKSESKKNRINLPELVLSRKVLAIPGEIHYIENEYLSNSLDPQIPFQDGHPNTYYLPS